MAPGIFSAGADLKERKEIPPEEVGPFVARARKFFREFQEVPVPTICALDGAALGGGLEWAISHDLRVAAGKIRLELRLLHSILYFKTENAYFFNFGTPQNWEVPISEN